jgi:alkylation response protein AidB-like acyl-CoA dehydrogenase
MPNYSHFAIKPADAKVHTIFEVTPEIQHLAIARAFSGLGTEVVSGLRGS